MTTTEAEERVAMAIFEAFEEQGEWVTLGIQGGRLLVSGSVPRLALARAAIDEMNRMAEEQFGHKVFVEAEKREARN